MIDNKRIKKLACGIFATFFIPLSALSLTGCDFSFSKETITEQIQYEPYANTASSLSEIKDLMLNSMYNNEKTCNICISEESLINLEKWKTIISGLTAVDVEYRKVKTGYNVNITMEYWDYYPIINAYRTADSSQLNDRQAVLLSVYQDIMATSLANIEGQAEKEAALHDYIVDHVSYDPNQNTSLTAYNALVEGTAVCGGYTESFMTLLTMAGIENTTIAGSAGSQSHVWNAVKLDGKWYHVDVTWDDPINGDDRLISHDYFNLTDSEISSDHYWDKEAQPVVITANSHDYSYPAITNMTNIQSQSELNMLIKSLTNYRQDLKEFISSAELDFKTAVSYTMGGFTYSVRQTKRDEYTVYRLSFVYN